MLVVAWEDHRFDLRLASPVVPLLVGLHMDETGKQVEQAVAPEHVFPKPSGAVSPPGRVGRVASAAVTPLVERQEIGRGSGQPGGHQNRLGIGGEMDQGAALEREDRLARIPVPLVLAARVLDGLTAKRVFQFDRGDTGMPLRLSVTSSDFSDLRRIAKLARNPGAVGLVAGLQAQGSARARP